MTHDYTHVVKHTADAAAAGIAGAALLSWLPPTAAALSIIWLSIQIFTWIRNEIRSRGKIPKQ